MYKIFTKYLGMPPGYVNKSLLIMKVLVVILLTTVLQVKATNTVAQKITLKERNASLSSVLEKIRTQSGFGFVFSEALIDATNYVNVEINNGTVEQALTLTLKDKPLSFTIENRVVIIKKRVEYPVFHPLEQDSVINGKVLDAITKEPIQGVTVSVSGGKSSAQTSKDGIFRVRGQHGSVLTFTYIGYTQKQVVIKNTRTTLVVTLEETVNNMKDVVINGIFTRKAETATGSQTTVTREELLKAGTLNVLQSLRNIDPSFSIVENRLLGSDPNALPDINVRGTTGLPDLNGEFTANPNLPLFILDGFETTLRRVMDLDMYRIASVTILKDAASKAIYGAKAANGVVVIETLRPAEGKLRIGYNTSIGYEMPDLSSYNLANGLQKLQAEKAAGIYDAANLITELNLNRQYNEYLTNVVAGIETDWIAKPLRNGIRQTHSLRFEGGDQAFVYGVTVNYSGINGVMKGSANNTWIFRQKWSVNPRLN